LEVCRQYRRAVGYFSSTALVTWAAGLSHIAESEQAVVKLIISPNLSPTDISTLRQTVEPESRRQYELMLLDNILEDIAVLASNDSAHGARARVFAWLLVHGKLELKFAFPEHVLDPGIFHEKIGVFDFDGGLQVAFTGSANETISGHESNWESIDVYRSWVAGDVDRVETKAEQFDEAWSGLAPGLLLLEPSPNVLAKVRRMAPEKLPKPPPQVEEAPPPDDLWRHQDDAIAAFLARKSGILEMATGTGKTRTALRILQDLFSRSVVDSAIIATDGTDLLEQWSGEVRQWCLKAFPSFATLQHFGPHHDLGEFAISPGQTILVVSRLALGKALRRLTAAQKARMIIVHDEVHGLGAPALQQELAGQHASFPYRLGLSATPERAYDALGNAFIANEIGETIFDFPLEKAIAKGVLCEFDYEPLEYHLTDEDSARIQQVYAKQAARKAEGRPMSEEEIWIELSRVYKTAEMKPHVFAQRLGKDASILQRCIIFVETREYGERIMERIHPHTYSYRTYYAEDEQAHLMDFAEGRIDCLVTCHRISQGIDIQSLKHSVLFASARSKLETIQRIGRCLRRDPDDPDKRALVIDFVRPQDNDGKAPNADQDRCAWLTKLATVRKGDDVGT
jgi:superfamily II DNA or RNA helicase